MDMDRLGRLTHLTEPLIETCRRNARVVARNEGLIVQLRAEVTCVGIRNYLARVVLCAQESLDKLGKTYSLGTCHLDDVIDRCAQRDVGHRGGHVIRRDRLHKSR